jgi:RHS repeat-associated protein
MLEQQKHSAFIRSQLAQSRTDFRGSISTDIDTYAGNTTGEYWQVWTPDGTRWLFGIDNQTENKAYAFNYYWPGHYELPYNSVSNQYGGYAGRAEGVIARAWFLRSVYAPTRDDIGSGRWSVKWEYETGSNTITPKYTHSDLSQPDEWVRPIKVIYGPSLRPDGSVATQRWLVQFDYWGGAAWPRLSNIYVGMGDANGNAWHWLRRYELGTTNGQPLDGVLEYGINASGNWQSGLPRTTFGYIVLPHNNNLAPPLLNHIENGYGASWDYEYTGDATWNSYWITKAWTRTWVSNEVIWTGLTTYSYSDNRCFATSSSANVCVNPAHVWNNAWPNNLVGFEWVNESVANPANANQKYSQTYHYFHYNNLHKLGKEWQTRIFDSNGTVLSAQITEFYDWPDITGVHGLPSGAWFVATKETRSYPFGDITSSPYKRVVYDYDDNFNGGWAQRALVGVNLTRQVDYGFVCGGATCDGDEVTTRYGYYPNVTTNQWIVNKTAWENIYAGANITDEWPAGFRAQSILYYDGSDNLATPPVKGQLTKVGTGNSNVPAEWVTQQIGYDATGNITAITDGRGNTTNASYDVNGWFMTTAQTPPNDANTRLTTAYRYYGVDENGCAGGGFAPYGTLKCSIDPNNVAATSYSYDHFGRLRKLVKPGDTFAQPTEEYFYYNPNTNTGADPNNPFMVQRFVRKTSGTGVNPWGNDDGGWWTASQASDLNALATWSRTFYDGLGRVIEAQTPMADWAYGGQIVVSWTSYDTFGRVWQQSVPYNVAYSGSWYRRPDTAAVRSTTIYDALSRVTNVTGPDGATTQQLYDTEDSLARVRSVDANAHVKAHLSDGLGRLRKVKEYGGVRPNQWLSATTTYAYDVLGNLTGVTDDASNSTTITYDTLSRKKGMNDPDMGAWAYDYDANGNLIWQRDAKGQVLTFRFDALNRMTDKYVNGVWTSWNRYDETGNSANALGRRTRSGLGVNMGANWSNETYYNYDTRGRMTREYRTVDGAGWFETKYTFDAADRVTSMTYPGGEVLTTEYDAAGQPSRLLNSLWNGSPYSGYELVQGASYNVLGKASALTLANGLRTRFSYMGVDIVRPAGYGDANWGRLRQICVLPQSQSGNCYDWSFNTNGTTNTRMNIGYWYDSVGNVANFDEYDKGYGTGFGYDELDRLTSASGATNETYTYDAIGNLKTKTGVGNYDYKTSPGWGCNAGPHAVIRTSITAYCYDANGNVKWRWAEAPFIYGYEWNADNKITKVNKLSTDGAYTNLGTLAEFTYDADGNRVKKTEGSGPIYTESFNTFNPAKWQFDNNLQSLVNDGGNMVVSMTGPNNSSWPGVHRTSNSLHDNQSMLIDFKLSQINSGMHLMLHSHDGDARWAVVENGGNIFAHFIVNSQNTGWAVGGTLISNAVPGRWYRATLRISDVVGFSATVCERDNANVCGSWTRAMPVGKLWKFDSTSNSGVVYLDNYVERTDVGNRVSYVGDIYEVSEPVGTPQPAPTSQPTPTNPPPTPTSTSVPNTPTPTGIPPTPTPTKTATPAATNTPTPTATPSGGGSNLLTNGGFETSDFTGWELWDTGQSVNNSNARTGSYGAKSTKGQIRQNFATVAGQTYYVSAWIRIDSLQQAPTWGGIAVKIQDANWQDLGSVTLTPATSPFGQWTQVQFSFVAAGTLSRLQIGPFTDGQYTISVDDAAVSTNGNPPASTNTPAPTPTNTPTPTATPSGDGSNLLTNGGFETGNFTSWEMWDTGQSVNNSNARTGSYGAKSTKGQIRQNFATVAGQTYYVSAWIRIDSQQQASTWGGIQVQTLDSNWNNLNNVVLTLATSPLGQWTRVQFSFVAAGTPSRLHAGQFTDGMFTISMDDFVVSNSPIGSAPSHGGSKVIAKPALRPPQQQGTFCTGKGYKAGCTITSYYYFSGQRVAMRVQSDANPTGAVTWLHSDVLGSASLLTNANGSVVSQARYKPFGDTRSEWSVYLTDRKFTGQREESTLGGIYDFNARYYDPVVGRFLSPDTLVQNPSDPQSLNRFAYGFNSPLKYIDLSGHVSMPIDSFWQWLAAVGVGFAAAVGSPAVVAVGVAGGGVTGLTVACLEYCNGSWDEPRYESFPLPAESGIEIMTTPLAGGKTTTMLASPQGGPTMPTIEAYPVTGPSQPLVLANPSNPAGVPPMGGPLFARPKDVPDNVPDYDRSKYGTWKPGVQQKIMKRDNYTCQDSSCGQRGGDMTIDHKISLWYHWYYMDGWKMTDKQRNNWFNDESNLQTMCPSCNSSKGNR